MNKIDLARRYQVSKWFLDTFFTRECNTFSEQILVKLDNFILQTIWKRFGIGGRGGEEGWWEESACAF